jgi:hypothetical protein
MAMGLAGLFYYRCLLLLLHKRPLSRAWDYPILVIDILASLFRGSDHRLRYHYFLLTFSPIHWHLFQGGSVIRRGANYSHTMVFIPNSTCLASLSNDVLSALTWPIIGLTICSPIAPTYLAHNGGTCVCHQSFFWAFTRQG